MKIGTIEPLTEEPPVKRKVGRASAGGMTSNGGGGNNNNGGGGDDDGGSPKGGNPGISPVGRDYIPPDKAKFVTAFLLLVVLMTFGGMIAAYVVVATNGVPEWKPFDLPGQVWISTFIIIASSLSYQIGKKFVDNDDLAAARRWFGITAGLGCIFIASQIAVWFSLVSRGLYVGGDPYAGFFYILTAVHAIHVLGGLIALGTVIWRTGVINLEPGETIRRKNLARSVGWYWHFMGALWIVLFLMLGFWH